MHKPRLQPFNSIYIDLSELSERYKCLARTQAKQNLISCRFIYSQTNLSMWQMFACQSQPIIIWTENDRKQLSYYRLISRYLTSEMREDKAELEMKHVLVFGEIYPPSNRAMIEAYGAHDEYSLYHKTRNVMGKEIDLTDSQRAQLLQLYKSKLQSLGDEVFFDQFDSIRRQCYDEIGIDLEEMEAMERSRSAKQLGKHGGESRSESKSQAARENGKRGGRKKSVANVQLGLNLDDI